MNIAQLLEHLTKIFPVNTQDFELINLIKKINSILLDPSLVNGNGDKFTEFKERFKQIRDLVEKIKETKSHIKSQLLSQNIDDILSSTSLDDQKKLTEINALLVKTHNLISNDSVTAYGIHEILTDNSLNLEQKRNSLEASLINNIQQEKDLSRIKLFKLALKIELYDRGYFTDEAGQLECRLLMPPEGKSNNPDFFCSKHPSKAPEIWHHVNRIRSEISLCFDGPEPYCAKLERLAKIINGLIKRYNQLKPDPSLSQEESAFYEKSNGFLLTYLNTVANTIKKFMVQKQDQDWSLWASASLEVIIYLEHIKSDNYIKYIGGSNDDQKREKIKALELETHLNRARYFISQSKHFNEPIAYYLEHKLFTPHTDLNATLKIFSEKSARHFNPDDFLTAYNILLNYHTKPEELCKSHESACAIERNGHSLGLFIRTVTYIFTHPLSKELLNEYLDQLQLIAIPTRWRIHVANLWFCLSDFLFDRFIKSEEIFLKEAALLCVDQIYDNRYPSECKTISNHKRAKLNGNEIDQKTELAPLQDLLPTNASFPSSKKDQLLLCEFYSSNQNQLNRELISNLLTIVNPYSYSAIIHLLESDSPAKKYAVEAVAAKFGEQNTNPLIFCEKILFPIPFNGYFNIWQRLKIQSLEKNYSPSVVEWHEFGFSSDNIRYKLLNEIRYYLQTVMFEKLTNPGCIIPGGCNILTDIDTEIHGLVLSIIRAHHETKTNSFAFARNREGLLQAIYALLLLEEKNYNGALLMAELSIMTAPSASEAMVSPKLASQPETPIQPLPQNDSTHPTVRKALFMKHSKQGGSENKLDSKSSKRTPSTVSSGKFSSSESRLPHMRSPESKSDPSLRPLPLSPRSLAPSSQIISLGNRPTCLGHLIKALVFWDTRLRENQNRKKEDITKFVQALNDARLAPDIQEHRFISGMIWMVFLDSRGINKGIDGDSFILLPAERALLDTPEKVLTPERRQYIAKMQLDETEQCIYEIALEHFEAACTSDNDNALMFPPAIVAIYKNFMYHKKDLACDDSATIEKKQYYWAKLLHKAIFDLGYLPALNWHAQTISHAEAPQKTSNFEVLKLIESKADLLRFLKEAILVAEQYIYVLPEIKSSSQEQLSLHEKEEGTLKLSILGYTREIPKPFEAAFIKLQFEMKYHHSTLVCQSVMRKDGTQKHEFVITCFSAHKENVTRDSKFLHQQFLRAQFIYSCCKVVSFSPDEPVVLLNESQIIIRHADVVIKGLIRITQANDTIFKLDKTQVEPLITFLDAASKLPMNTWQWNNTYVQLEEFLGNYRHQAKTLK